MTTQQKKNRLDIWLTEHQNIKSRSRARDLIKQGHVLINGSPAHKASQSVQPDDIIEIADAANTFVSRGALKLKAALEVSGYLVGGRTCLDLGASTGGFSELLLQEEASIVYAVEIGHSQLDPALLKNDRLKSIEKTDCRHLTSAIIPKPVEAITSDLSFIALQKALPAGLALAAPDAWIIALVKPQFQLTPKDIGKGGIVRDTAKQKEAVDRFSKWLEAQSNWKVTHTLPSPIKGQSGNQEYLVCAQRQPNERQSNGMPI